MSSNSDFFNSGVTASLYFLDSTCLTFDAEAAGVQCSALGGGDIDLQTQLFQRPAVGLSHILAGCGDVSLWHKQAAEAHVDVLDKEKRKMTYTVSACEFLRNLSFYLKL